MPVKIRKRAASDTPTPTRVDVVELFVDTDDVIKFKDSLGVVRTAVSVAGDPISLARQTSAPAAEANTDKLYAKNVTELEVFVRDNTGDEIQLTNQGGPAASGGSAGVFWSSTNQIKADTGDVLGSGVFDVIMPEPLAPPPGVFSQYILDMRMTSAGPGDPAPPEGIWGGFEISFTLVFLDIPGTPDVRLAPAIVSGFGYIEDLNSIGPLLVSFSPSLISIDSSGVLTVEFINSKGSTLNGKIVATVAGPFVFPAVSQTPVP